MRTRPRDASNSSWLVGAAGLAAEITLRSVATAAAAAVSRDTCCALRGAGGGRDGGAAASYTTRVDAGGAALPSDGGGGGGGGGGRGGEEDAPALFINAATPATICIAETRSPDAAAEAAASAAEAVKASACVASPNDGSATDTVAVAGDDAAPSADIAVQYSTTSPPGSETFASTGDALVGASWSAVAPPSMESAKA